MNPLELAIIITASIAAYLAVGFGLAVLDLRLWARTRDVHGRSRVSDHPLGARKDGPVSQHARFVTDPEGPRDVKLKGPDWRPYGCGAHRWPGNRHATVPSRAQMVDRLSRELVDLDDVAALDAALGWAAGG